MTHRERFNKLFTFRPVDRMPVYYFGTWPQTCDRWVKEGLAAESSPSGHMGPQLPGMDPDWEPGLWDHHGIVHIGPVGDKEWAVLEDRGATRVVRSGLGKIDLIATDGSSIPHTLSHPLNLPGNPGTVLKNFST